MWTALLIASPLVLLVAWVLPKLLVARGLRARYTSPDSSAEEVSRYLGRHAWLSRHGRYLQPTFGSIAYALHGDPVTGEALLRNVVSWKGAPAMVLQGRWMAQAICALARDDLPGATASVAEMKRNRWENEHAQRGARAVELLVAVHTRDLTPGEIKGLGHIADEGPFLYAVLALWALIESASRTGDSDGELDGLVADARAFVPGCVTVWRAVGRRHPDA